MCHVLEVSAILSLSGSGVTRYLGVLKNFGLELWGTSLSLQSLPFSSPPSSSIRKAEIFQVFKDPRLSCVSFNAFIILFQSRKCRIPRCFQTLSTIRLLSRRKKVQDSFRRKTWGANIYETLDFFHRRYKFLLSHSC